MKKTVIVTCLIIGIPAIVAGLFSVFKDDLAKTKTSTLSISEISAERKAAVDNTAEEQPQAEQIKPEDPASGGQPQEVATPVVTQPEKNSEKSAPKTDEEKPATVEKLENDDAKKSSSAAKAGSIVDRLISWGYEKSSKRAIDTIIIHSSYNVLGGDVHDVDKIIEEYRMYQVGAHYLIDREGVILRLIEDSNIAYHAGASKVPDGRTNVNAFSLGIELINTESGNYTDEQYAALNRLLATLKEKYDIKYILGHDQIAPGRKTDPWNIDWSKVRK